VQDEQQWELHVAVTDHWVWKDPATFVGIVSDAGEWTVNVETIEAAYKEAQQDGTAPVFTAPKYVVKAYVRELENYGLIAKAFPAEVEEEAPALEEETAWSRKDWKDLSPDQKEAADAPSDEEAGKGDWAVVMHKSEHISLVADKKAALKFKAYVEMAAEAAKRWSPDEGTLNAAHTEVLARGTATVLTDLQESSAKDAAAQLKQAGFKVEILHREAAPTMRR